MINVNYYEVIKIYHPTPTENKKNYFSNTIEGKNAANTNKSKKTKNQYPLFFSTHDYTIDSIEYINSKTKNKKNK